MNRFALLLILSTFSACSGSSDAQGPAAGGLTSVPATSTSGGEPRATTVTDAAADTEAARPDNPGFGQRDIPPDFKLKVLANGTGEQSLYSLVGPSSRGTVDGVVVAFVASWCGRCKESYPMLESLQKQYGDRLRILLLTAETDQAGKDKMVAVVKEKGLTLPLLDAPPELVDLWLGTRKNIPRFFLVDYNGAIMVKDTGYGKKMAKILPAHVDRLMSLRFDREKAGG